MNQAAGDLKKHMTFSAATIDGGSEPAEITQLRSLILSISN
jgi:hypothetical protein